MKKFIKRLSFIFQIRKSIPFIISFFKSNDVPIMKKLLFISLGIGYFLFPFDLVPDFLIPLGIFDDVTLLAFILNQMVKHAPPSLKKEYQLTD
ncbi:DUF1232 domain-containing protein [Microaerobacter geothermalis]|uniref:YkvA family protein n=1 Tax=Microaerobacter geothermalis TaxID=674972 RepID=UPI001F45ACD1|nr:DUF1232 domain-containing protein [Microaerobacter geothermalis]MCF6093294.1 DUF1232 domain-containing protein [Microaerobacter geothermalis]